MDQAVWAMVQRVTAQGVLKPRAEWFRDLVRVVTDEGWARWLDAQDGATVRRELRHGLAELLNDRTDDAAAITLAERVVVAAALARVGDPRYPVARDQWKTATLQRTTAAGHGGPHYWCAVPAGRAVVGGWDEETAAMTVALPPYWVGRLLVTVEQYAEFIAAGGYREARWWTEEGWAWVQAEARRQPWLWPRQWRTEHQNYPVWGVTWYEADAYGRWLTEAVAAVLPAGYRIGLGRDVEWEAAMTGMAMPERPPYPWGMVAATPAHAVYGRMDARSPCAVGIVWRGDAWCGAVDGAGNLWEWTSTPTSAAPDQAAATVGRRTVMSVRGGGYEADAASIGCGARTGYLAAFSHDDVGFRCFLLPT